MATFADSVRFMSSYELEHGLGSIERPQRRNIALALLNILQGGETTLEVPDFLEDLLKEPKTAGMPQSYVDSLDRIPKKKLSQDDECAICRIPYFEDEYPLVVSLSCPGRHRFDLECVGAWLSAHKTCPMCRHDLSARPTALSDSEEEEDLMYG